MWREQLAHATLRIGAAFGLFYPPIAAVFDPLSWLGYFPQVIRALPIDSLTLLHGFGVIEIVLAVWILSGWKIFIPALLATLMLVGIVLFNLGQIDIVFRDLSIAAMTLALALWPQATPSSIQEKN